MGRIGAADSISKRGDRLAPSSISPYRRCDQHASHIGAVDNVHTILVLLTYQPCWRKTYQPYWPTDRATRESTTLVARHAGPGHGPDADSDRNRHPRSAPAPHNPRCLPSRRGLSPVRVEIRVEVRVFVRVGALRRPL